jgi:hypothetical protein
MRLKERSYPHPVLGNRDDFVSSQFQASFSMEPLAANASHWELRAVYACGNAKLKKLIRDHKAKYVCHIECGATVYRRQFSSYSEDNTFRIPCVDVAHELAVTGLIVADADIPNYRPLNPNPDYGSLAFHVRAGDILGQDPDGTKDFDLSRDAISDGLGCLLRVVPGGKHCRFMEIMPTDERLHVVLPQSDYDNWLKVRAANRMVDQHILSTTFVLPAVVFALQEMKDHPEVCGVEGQRWAKALGRILEERRLNLDKQDPLEIAQQLLDSPIARACRESYSVIMFDQTGGQ